MCIRDSSEHITCHAIVFRLVVSTAQLCFNKRIPHLCTLEVGQRMYQSRFKVMSRSNRSSLQSTIHTLCIRILGTNSIKLETKTQEIGYAIFTCLLYTSRMCIRDSKRPLPWNKRSSFHLPSI